MARFQSLLKIFGLENRLINGINELNKVMDIPINWERVKQRKKTRQILAKKTLEECLKN